MGSTAKHSDPALWARVKADVTAGEKGGEAGQWSARKAQIATAEYKKRGGGYEGARRTDNSLTEWTREDWGTRSGKPSGKTHERYLPKAERERLSDADYARTTAKKRADTKKGKQYSAQPADIAARTNRDAAEPTKTELYAEARKRDVAGRSRMSKAELAHALEK